MIAKAIPSGRKIAAYLRVSSDLQETESQRQTIQQWATRHNLEILFWFEDSEGRNPRDQSAKRKRFQELLRAVEAGLVDFIIVDSQDRFGTKDAYELGAFMTLLAKHHCQLWSVSQGRLDSNDDATVLTSTLGAITSRREQRDKGHRNVRGKVAKAKRGLYSGGYPPYGLDIVAFGPDSQEKWRVVANGHFKRTKVWPNGRTEEFNGENNFPSRDQHDELRYRPSIVTARLDVVRQIFDWFSTEDISERQIATRLRNLGMDPVFSQWEKVRIKQMLRNPIYIGLPTWNKRAGSRFAEYLGGEIKEVENTTPGRTRDPSDYVQPAQREFEPIVPVPLWDKVQAKFARIQAGLTPAQRKKAPRQDMEELWLAGFLYCGHCGKPMRRNLAKGTYRLKPNYFCATYGTFGQSNPTGCRCHRVHADLLHDMVDSYLETVPFKAEELRQAPESLLRLVLGFYREQNLAADQVLDVADQIKFLLSKLTKAEAKQFLANHPGIVARRNRLTHQDVIDLCQLIDKRSSAVGDELAAVQAEHERMSLAYLDLPLLAQKKALVRVQALEGEIQRLEAQVEGLASRYDRVHVHLEQLENSAQAAKKALQSVEHRRKAELLRDVISRITVRFRYTDKEGKPTRKKSFIDQVEIVPVSGPTVMCRPNGLCFTNGIEQAPS